MQYSLETLLTDTAQSIAIPLRILEVFTTPEDTGIIIETHSDLYLKKIFAYLVKNKYFEQVKQLIEAKIPPNSDSLSTPPTPMTKWFLEMIQRPLSIVNLTDNANEFCFLILHEFYTSVLSEKLTDSISAYIIPSLLEFKEFPYDKLINCINRYNPQPTISLLYSVLHLEPSGYCKLICMKENVF
jgi:ubiquitin-protein ligase E3 C